MRELPREHGHRSGGDGRHESGQEHPGRAALPRDPRHHRTEEGQPEVDRRERQGEDRVGVERLRPCQEQQRCGGAGRRRDGQRTPELVPHGCATRRAARAHPRPDHEGRRADGEHDQGPTVRTARDLRVPDDDGGPDARGSGLGTSDDRGDGLRQRGGSRPMRRSCRRRRRRCAGGRTGPASPVEVGGHLVLRVVRRSAPGHGALLRLLRGCRRSPAGRSPAVPGATGHRSGLPRRAERAFSRRRGAR
jgi:hypothetical protein